MSRATGGARGPRRTGRREAAGGSLAALAVAAGLLAPAGAASAQEAGEARAVARLEPDTVRVGEPFTLGVTVRGAGEGATVVFPRVVAGSPSVEQVEPVRTREEEGVRRAYYRLVAWRDGEVALPAVEVDLGEAGGVTAAPPAVTVRSVLPDGADADTLELRQARPYLQAAGFPWLWLAAALAAAAAAWWLHRRWRARARPAATGPSVAERTLRDLARLRDEWRAGALTTASFFDRFESILRRFGGETLGWPAGWPLRALVGDDPDLGGALDRSALVRFARLRAVDRAVLEAVEAGREWVRRDDGRGPADDDGPPHAGAATSAAGRAGGDRSGPGPRDAPAGGEAP